MISCNGMLVNAKVELCMKWMYEAFWSSYLELNCIV